MTPRRIVASYLIAQALGTACWWCLLLSNAQAIAWFQPSAWPDESLLSFWLADFCFLIVGSVVTAVAVAQERSWGSIALWCLAVATWYPTLYCIAQSIMTDEAWIASAMMVLMSGICLSMATMLGAGQQTPATIRATPLSKRSAVLWTFAQTVIFWSVFLWIIPKGIVEGEARLGWAGFSHPGQMTAAPLALLAASLLGIWSGATMATAGDGTPLPTATAPKLVVSGPYRFVRNPMALAGIAQGLAVGWWLGSFTVLAYSLAGAVLWHLFVRPVEESDLHARFGASYEQYCGQVRLWIPTLSSRVE